MKKKPLPSKQVLESLLVYEPDTGLLFWRDTMERAFYSIRDGYFSGKLKGHRDLGKFKAARVIWKLMWDYEPDYMDHINGNRLDDRLWNLRSVTPSANACNRVRFKNKSGTTGVYWQETHKSWRVEITDLDGTHYLGHFKDKEKAISVRKEAEANFLRKSPSNIRRL